MIMLILDDEHAHQMRTAGMEVKARGADVIIITDKPAVSQSTRYVEEARRRRGLIV